MVKKPFFFRVFEKIILFTSKKHSQKINSYFLTETVEIYTKIVYNKGR